MGLNQKSSALLAECNGANVIPRSLLRGEFIHESPRRGETFVTMKITRAATRIKLRLQDKPDDFVVAIGETHSVREFTEKVFQKLDLEYKEHVVIDQKYYRPSEVDFLQGDARKARKNLGWETKVTFDQLIDMMIEADLELARKEKTLQDAGYVTVNNYTG